ncbi:MAG: ADP-ribosylglycohydrolase family protein [Bacteroidota bacterium]
MIVPLHLSRSLTTALLLAVSLLLAAGPVSAAASAADEGERSLPRAVYQDRVAASWLGQIVGNIYGLAYEFQFLERPGPDAFPYGYGSSLDRVLDVGGAFSDDDTDIEYLSLIQMERHGPEPTYRHLADAWKHHIRDRIWAANRVALTLMHHGHWPPATGDSTNNPRWFEIDPQLVNEIWAVTAPGMVDYAVGKTAWAARMTNDGFGVEPALFYAAMYAEAFFTDEVAALIDTGVRALPADGRFAGVVREMQALHRAHPDDWQAARQALHDRHYGPQPYNLYGWAPIDATLNGAAAVLALLYGDGDLWRTLDLACAMGYDADNQAATLTGLLALAQGTQALPRDLLFPLDDEEWARPFNDRYVNVTRHDLPDARLTDLARRLAEQGEAVLLENGGRLAEIDGAVHLVVPADAHFEPPFEVLPPATTLTEVGASVEVTLYAAGGGHPGTWDVAGVLPPGLRFADGRLFGTAEIEGTYAPTITFAAGGRSATVQAHVVVRSPNQAGAAVRLLHHAAAPDLERLRDGKLKHPAFYSATHDAPVEHWYGFEWADAIPVGRLGLHVGFPREEWGWLQNPTVEIRAPDGTWVAVTDLAIDPPFPPGVSKYLQPGMVAYDLRFDPVETTAVRVVGTAGGHPVDGPPTFGSSIAELSVHAR